MNQPERRSRGAHRVREKQQRVMPEFSLLDSICHGLLQLGISLQALSSAVEKFSLRYPCICREQRSIADSTVGRAVLHLGSYSRAYKTKVPSLPEWEHARVRTRREDVLDLGSIAGTSFNRLPLRSAQ